MEIPDFKESMAQARRQSQARRDAFYETRAKAAGRSREEIRDVYESELRSRGLKIPSEDILDANLDAISGDYRSTIRLGGHALVDLTKLIGSIFHPHD